MTADDSFRHLWNVWERVKNALKQADLALVPYNALLKHSRFDFPEVKIGIWVKGKVYPIFTLN